MMTPTTINPTQVSNSDPAASLFDAIYQMHPQLRGEHIEWHTITPESYSPTITVACEIKISTIPLAQFLLAKQNENEDPILIDSKGVMYEFVLSDEISALGNRFKMLVINRTEKNENSQISISGQPEGANVLAAIYYTPPQQDKHGSPVEESLTIYNANLPEIAFRYLYGKKRDVVPILLQFSKLWRTQAPIANKQDHLPSQQTNDDLSSPQTTTDRPSVIEFLIKQMEMQISTFQSSREEMLKEKILLEAKIKSLEIESATQSTELELTKRTVSQLQKEGLEKSERIMIIQHDNEHHEYDKRRQEDTIAQMDSEIRALQGKLNEYRHEADNPQKIRGVSPDHFQLAPQERSSEVKSGELNTQLSIAQNKIVALQDQLAKEQEHSNQYRHQFDLSHQTIQEGLKTEHANTQLANDLVKTPKTFPDEPSEESSLSSRRQAYTAQPLRKMTILPTN